MDDCISLQHVNECYNFYCEEIRNNKLKSTGLTCNSNNHREKKGNEERHENQNKLPLGERVKSHLDGANRREDNQQRPQR